ncbi:Trafficking protein particle complex subunit 2 [Paragonimus heterotremus]|uniref:Trafficking protein particle complex subunit 2 n=1 Tax=Paragonimus heterotremus TaxID=100268 RepID=A0A8J4SY61_9TREM|nr:Trafficking protein particle complex subunit 2 [Paragonimus heterotremus]
MVGRYYFAIVGHDDEALFDFEYSSNKSSESKPEEHRHLNQFVAHAALDVIDEQLWNTTNTFLKSVDKFNEWIVSAFVTPSSILFQSFNILTSVLCVSFCRFCCITEHQVVFPCIHYS